jgi:mitochondrial-processing peptidase subunit beta
LQEITRLAYETDDADVQLAKNSVKSSIVNANCSTQGVCEELGRQLLVYGRHIPRDEMFARIDDVSPSTVRECGSRLIQDQDMAVAGVGELSFLPDYNWFRRNSYWIQY